MINFQEYIDKLVEIEFIENEDIIDVGIVEKVDEEFILIKSLTPNGFKDGYSLIKKNQISVINIDTDYLKDLQVLMKENSKENIINSYIYKYSNINLQNENKIKENILLEVLKKQLICKIETKEKNIYGFIKEIKEDKIFVKYFEEEDFVNIDDIENIFIDTIDSREEFLIDSIKKK